MSWLRLTAMVALSAISLSGCADSKPPPVESQKSTTSAPPSSKAAPTPKPLLGWHVTADNVGLRSKGLTCAALPEYTGPTDVPSGTTISEMRFTTPMNVAAGNITIERSCFQPVTVGRGLPVLATTNFNTSEVAAGKITVRDSEFDGSLLSLEDSAMVVAFGGVGDLTNNFIHHFGTGIVLMGTGLQFDVLVELNYVTDLLAWGDSATDGNHSDGFTLRDFDSTPVGSRKATIRNNRFDCDSGNDTGALFIQSYAGPIHNVTIEGNLLEGGGYQLGLNEFHHPYSEMRAVNNRFAGTGYGPAYVQGGSGWDVWEDNFLFSPSQPAARGNEVQRP